MKNEKFEMELLNNEEMNKINGGALWKCNKKGDTVVNGGDDGSVVVCMGGELSCKPSVSTKCGPIGGVTVTGCTTVTLKPTLKLNLN